MGKETKELHHNRIKSPWRIYMMCLNASLGIFFLGFNQGVFNVVQLIILELNDVEDEDKRSLYSSLMTSFNPLGGLIGALLGTYALRIFKSLKKSFIAMDILGIIATIIILVDFKVANIVVGRFFQGLAQGVNCALVPIYIREFSPLEISGVTGSFVQLGQKGGLLMSYLFGLILPTKHWLKDNEGEYDNEYEWRIVLCVPILFCLIRTLMLLCVFRSDTPNEALKEHHEEQLIKFLHLIYKDQDFDDAYNNALKKYHELELKEKHEHEHELQHSEHDVEHHAEEGHDVQTDHGLGGEKPKRLSIHAGPSGELKEKEPHGEFNPDELTESQIEREEEEFERIEKATKCRRNMLGWTISLTVSFSGIDAIFYYSNKMFEEGGLSDYATVVTICIGISSILFSFVGMSVVDSAGRRPLLIGGSFIMTMSLIALVIGDIVGEISLIITAIIFFMFGYNATLGPIKWACYVELMDAFGVSVAASLIFVFAFLIAIVFPFLVQWIELYGAFSIFLGLSVCCLLYLFFNFKETKGQTARQIYPKFMKGYKEKKIEKPVTQNVHVLELQGVSNAWLEPLPDKNNKKVSMASIHKSIHKSYHRSIHK